MALKCVQLNSIAQNSGLEGRRQIVKEIVRLHELCAAPALDPLYND